MKIEYIRYIRYIRYLKEKIQSIFISKKPQPKSKNNEKDKRDDIYPLW